MTVQTYWQNRADPADVKLILQASFDDPDEALKWATKVFEKHKAEMPDGFCPMVMAPEDHVQFTP